jgi:hypothetical protein
MKSWLLLFIFPLLFEMSAFASSKVCVLGYERKEHPFSKTLKELFLSNPSTHLIVEAKPKDFLDCITSDFSEIVMVVHTLSDVEGNLKFGYYSQEGLEQNGRQLYATKSFMNQTFKLARLYLQNKVMNGQQVQLKEIRLLTCDPFGVIKSYPDFQILLTEYKIFLDTSPKQELVSFFSGHRASTVDSAWLSESLLPFGPSLDNEYFYSYLELSTYLLYREGQSTALHGKYKIKLKGLAFGLSSKWSLLFIKYADVANLEVGQSKSIVTPHLDLSAAIWLNIEVGLAPVPKIQLPSEINSLGASLGVLSSIEIKRIY